MTWRAGVWAIIEVGRHLRAVSQIAAELGVSWSAVMNTVTELGKGDDRRPRTDR